MRIPAATECESVPVAPVLSPAADRLPDVGLAGHRRDARTPGERTRIWEQATAAAARATEQIQAGTDPHAAADAAWAASAAACGSVPACICSVARAAAAVACSQIRFRSPGVRASRRCPARPTSGSRSAAGDRTGATGTDSHSVAAGMRIRPCVLGSGAEQADTVRYHVDGIDPRLNAVADACLLYTSPSPRDS